MIHGCRFFGDRCFTRKPTSESKGGQKNEVGCDYQCGDLLERSPQKYYVVPPSEAAKPNNEKPLAL